MNTAAKVSSLEERLPADALEKATSNLRAYRAFLDEIRSELSNHDYELAINFGEMIERRRGFGQENFDVIAYLSYLVNPTHTVHPGNEYRGPPIRVTPDEIHRYSKTSILMDKK